LQGAGGVGGLLLTRNMQSGTTNFVSYDGNGNVAALVNVASSAVSAQYEYGPFGEVIRLTGSPARLNPFRFSTKYQDDESDQLYYGYRSYNPSSGKWLSRDPIEELGGHGLYTFAKNSPIAFIDNLGLITGSEKCCMCYISDLLNQGETDTVRQYLEFNINFVNRGDWLGKSRVVGDLMLLGTRGGQLGFALFARTACGESIKIDTKNDKTDKHFSVRWSFTKQTMFLNSAFRHYEWYNSLEEEFYGSWPESGALTIAHELGHAYLDILDPFSTYIVENPLRRTFGHPELSSYQMDMEDQPLRRPDRQGLIWPDNYHGFPWAISASAWFNEYKTARIARDTFISEWSNVGCGSFH
jgi:RHS repeat-associated protein